MDVKKAIATITAWPVTSHQAACRNAQLASTALTQLRVEREEAWSHLPAEPGTPYQARHGHRIA